MFTGIIEEIGKIERIISGSSKASLKIHCPKVLDESKLGDSIAVNGVCLTISDLQQNSFSADVMPITFQKSNLHKLQINSPVNLERAMPATGRFGGHLVSGHVENVGKISKIRREQNAVLLQISATEETLKYLIPEGSVALDGISLTIARLQKDSFVCSIIPHTFQQTNLQYKKSGDLLNIEVDALGKYIYHFLKRTAKPALDRTFLAKHGF